MRLRTPGAIHSGERSSLSQAQKAKQPAISVSAAPDASVTVGGTGGSGGAGGDVTVVTYMDYACGYCRASLPEIDRLAAEPRAAFSVMDVYLDLAQQPTFANLLDELVPADQQVGQ